VRGIQSLTVWGGQKAMDGRLAAVSSRRASRPWANESGKHGSLWAGVVQPRGRRADWPLSISCCGPLRYAEDGWLWRGQSRSTRTRTTLGNRRTPKQVRLSVQFSILLVLWQPALNGMALTSRAGLPRSNGQWFCPWLARAARLHVVVADAAWPLVAGQAQSLFDDWEQRAQGRRLCTELTVSGSDTSSCEREAWYGVACGRVLGDTVDVSSSSASAFPLGACNSAPLVRSWWTAVGPHGTRSARNPFTQTRGCNKHAADVGSLAKCHALHGTCERAPIYRGECLSVSRFVLVGTDYSRSFKNPALQLL